MDFKHNMKLIKYRNNLLNTIRKDKLDFIMPKALKENNVEMLIHVIRRGDADPFELDFGTEMGYVVFYLNEKEGRLDRALFDVSFAMIADETIFDIIGEAKDLNVYVKERNPKNIAVNMSDWLSNCDGLSYKGYYRLCDLLGKEYSERLISSEMVLTYFRVNRVNSEIAAFSRACEMQHKCMIEAYKNIVPGHTSLRDIFLMGDALLMNYQIQPHKYLGLDSACVEYSSEGEETNDPNYIVRKGDLVMWDYGFDYLNFGTDFKRMVYILKDNEYELPKKFQDLWASILEMREIMKMNLKPGKTAKETLKEIAALIEEKEYVYTPYTDTEEDENIIASLGNSDKIGFSIDCHCVGNTGNSEVAVGPSMAPFRKDREDLVINNNNLIAFEFSIHYWCEEKQKRLELCYEENALVTYNGIELLCPEQKEILVI